EAELLRLAASLEQLSEHPLGAAVVQAAQARSLKLSEPKEFRYITGRGVLGQVDGKQVVAGNAAVLRERGIDATIVANRSADGSGSTEIMVAVAGSLAGVLKLADPVKASTPATLRELKALGIRLVMLTGDNRNTAADIARQLGID